MQSAGDVLDRLKEYLGIKRDSELARAFGVARNTVTNWRYRKSIPFEHIVTFCEREEINLSWLLAGQVTTSYLNAQGLKALTAPGGDEAWDPEMMGTVVETVEEVFAQENLRLPPAKKARLIILLYEEARKTHERPEKGKIIELTQLAS